MNNVIPLHRVEAPCDVDIYTWLEREQPKDYAGDCLRHRRSRAPRRALFHGLDQRLRSTIAFCINGDGFYILASVLLAADFGFCTGVVPVSADWAVGDHLVCIDESVVCAGHRQHPKLGSVYTFLGYGEEGYWLKGPRHRGAILAEIRSDNHDGSYAEWRFRKIRPDEHEACEPEFVTLLKRSRKRVSA